MTICFRLDALAVALIGLLGVWVTDAPAQRVSTDLAMQRRGGTIPAGYTTPFPPLKIVANVYYVGMSDLAAYLITWRAWQSSSA